jgi:hypothetical protein
MKERKQMKKKNQKVLKEFVVTTSVTGKATALIKAYDEEHAKEVFFSNETGGPYSDTIEEWQFDDILDVEPNE